MNQNNESILQKKALLVYFSAPSYTGIKKDKRGRKAIAEKREADYSVRVERRKKAKNQNFLFKVGAVVLLIVVTLLWKEFVG